MPIFDQGYQHWQGHLSGHGRRWLTVARHGVRAQLQSRIVRLLLLVAWLPALAVGGSGLAVRGVRQKFSRLHPQHSA